MSCVGAARFSTCAYRIEFWASTILVRRNRRVSQTAAHFDVTFTTPSQRVPGPKSQGMSTSAVAAATLNCTSSSDEVTVVRPGPASDQGMRGPRGVFGHALAVSAFEVSAQLHLEEVQDDEGEASPLFLSGGQRGSRPPRSGAAATNAAPHAEAMLCSPHLLALGLTPPDVEHLSLAAAEEPSTVFGAVAARYGVPNSPPRSVTRTVTVQPGPVATTAGHGGGRGRNAGPAVPRHGESVRGVSRSPLVPGRRLSGRSLVRMPSSARSLEDDARLPSARAAPLHDGAGQRSPVLLAEGASGSPATGALDALPVQALPHATRRRRSFVAPAPHGGVAIISMHVLARAGLVHMDSAPEMTEEY